MLQWMISFVVLQGCVDNTGAWICNTFHISDPRTREVRSTNSNTERNRSRSRSCDGARSRRQSRSEAGVRAGEIAIVDGILLGFVFSFFFSKHQKIFSGKFFKMQPNTEKYFPFPEISIFGKYVFSGKYFTATKHSLSPLNFYSYLS